LPRAEWRAGGTPRLGDRRHHRQPRHVGSTPAEFAAFLAAEQPKWAELVRISGATVE